MKFCDLHIHSNCSDGVDAPEELIKIAKASGLSAVALCDHNTVAGVSRFEAAARGSGVIAVAGVEVTAEALGKEVHILGLFIKENVREKLTDCLSVINRRKEAAGIALTERLSAAGYEIDYKTVKALAGDAQPNRVHIARALMEKGYVSSVKEAFDKLLREGGDFYIPPKRLDALEVIEFLSSLNVLPVMAHPLMNLTVSELEEFLPKAKSRGLVGMETIYPLYDAEKTEKARELAERFSLLPSGGSDYHGINKPDTFMGKGKNNIFVPMCIYEGLRNAVKE